MHRGGPCPISHRVTGNTRMQVRKTNALCRSNAFALMLVALSKLPLCAGPLDVEVDDLRPGLAAQYRSLVDRDCSLSRIEAKPAFYLGFSSPHPRLPPGPFEVTWTGVLFLKDPAPIRF